MKISEEDKSPPDELVAQWLKELINQWRTPAELAKLLAVKAVAWGREQERAELLTDLVKAPDRLMQAAGACEIPFKTTALNKLWTANKVFIAMATEFAKAKEVADAKQ